jgi:glycosyltransferase involved in cell wall biosynthesis
MDPQPLPAEPVVSLVMPVFNEEATIAAVVREWDAALSRLGVPYEMRLYDDGSRDQTPAAIEALGRAIPNLRVLHHANRGHGPTILRGYSEAAGEWVLQVDSDGELPASALADLWAARARADLVIGYRVGRAAGPARRLVTAMSWLTVRVLFGRGVRDVNCPFRLYRQSVLHRLLADVPPDAFAPNVILAGLAVRDGLRIVERPVPYTERRAGTSSIVRWSLWRAAVRSFRQTIRVALGAHGHARAAVPAENPSCSDSASPWKTQRP